MKKKQAYTKIYKAHDLLWEVLENILYPEARKKDNDDLDKLIELLETAVDNTGEARSMLEGAQS